MKYSIRYLLPTTLTLATLLLPVAAQDQPQPQPQAAAPGNLATNGGFEEWVPASLPSDRPVPNVVDARTPADFHVSLEGVEKDAPVGVTIAEDTAIRHSGSSSIRIENTIPGQTGSVALRAVPAEPNTRYQIKIWIKGENIEGTRGGVAVWVHHGPADGFWSTVTSKRELKWPPERTGSFDWHSLEFTVDTLENADRIRVILQLRNAVGTVWFDDLEIVPLSAVDSVTVF